MGFFKVILPFASIVALATGQTAITITTGTKYQEIHGFGFSQAFGRAKEFQNAGSATQKAALDYLFSTTTGAGFSIIRNRIGSGGSGDSIEPTSPGSPSATPSYVWDGDDSGQVWFTKQAVSYGVRTIYADAWSAPGFMKTSGSDSTPGYLCGSTGHTCSSGDWRQAYANFLVKYVQLYASAGYNITHLGFLNEPDYQVSYSQMQISTNAQEAISFIPTLYNTVQSAGLSTKLTCCDAVGWGTTTQSYVPALVNGGSTKYLSVITSHSYSQDATTPVTGTSLPKWNTEGGPSTAFTTTWYSSGATNEGFTWANKLATAMVNAELSAYLFWEGFEIQQSQSGSHLVDALDGTNPTPSGIFWAFAMWSRYIRPGAYRVATSGSITSVIIGAFQNTDGSIVVVFTNSGTSAQSAKVSFSDFIPSSASAWVTSSSATFSATTATLSGGAVTVSIPAKGVVTVKLTGSGGSSNPPTTTTTTTTTTTAPASSGTPCAQYAQCGGQGWTGCTTCLSPYTCHYANDYYSQCL
ncbi:glycoside hydrolase family 5 protein [Thozetella sp. PMI_491]|nr:glycoside hydrolase family 5 protein [Thozetella sp. PMI_491]